MLSRLVRRAAVWLHCYPHLINRGVVQVAAEVRLLISQALFAVSDVMAERTQAPRST
jgi:hypothetical protein